MKKKLALLALPVAGLLMSATPASATTQNTTVNPTSIWDWSTGNTARAQSHAGDDINYETTSGIAVDVRWVKCTDYSVKGADIGNITAGYGQRRIGSNFSANYCFRLQYRGASQTGHSEGIVTWNANLD